MVVVTLGWIESMSDLHFIANTSTLEVQLRDQLIYLYCLLMQHSPFF